MKLKQTFIVYEAGEDTFLTAVGGEAFSGLVRLNKTAAFIVGCLDHDTTREEVIGRMTDTYDAPEDVIARDVDRVLDKLREVGALEEAD